MTETTGTEAGLRELLASRIRDVPDYPQPGVVFKDITPLLADPAAFSALTDALVERCTALGASKVAGLEARGFILAAPVAVRAGVGFVPIRKAGKLPGEVFAQSYELEYGSAVMEVQQGAFEPGERVLLVDDVLATGGTAGAALELLRRAGAVPVGLSVLLELGFLGGRERLGGHLDGVELDALLTT
ncbi:adenine phosphoribosyltransferase [Mangrovactinospora gilvigrisea]|uniref:Adenine phosphoribosyltransferase n=1 Tax=Mangrovactinospora gilvigrisea TaxID=1428644 RepID=A0A1J7BK96_9ACTN|nr:adenine phosphoribosyltransferase [Mangrovactinospora gilvigrisea]OIV39103.1 adenine phosphoribosyltransferase [Mangrovactinospora gilvigrisea]